jgi:hypothetical protein
VAAHGFTGSQTTSGNTTTATCPELRSGDLSLPRPPGSWLPVPEAHRGDVVVCGVCG